MSAASSIDPRDFVRTLSPFLHRKDVAGMAAEIGQRWDHNQITALFESPDADARKVAALAYGLVGGRSGMWKLVPLLKDPDAVAAQMAEHALWSIWFRLGTPEANHQVCCGTRAMNLGNVEKAVSRFSEAIRLDPTFAEAYNQRAIAMFLLERFDDSIDDCRQTVELMPCHFGALAGLGHCHAHEGRIVPAVRSYEKALRINPRLIEIQNAVEELRSRLCPDNG